MPNTGTGYVDWGQYVNANQGTVDRDRNKVQQYMQGEDTAARGAAQNAFGQTGYDAGINQGDKTGATDPWNQWINEVNVNQAALQSPEGFQQVLAKANANYDPTKKNAQGGYDAAPNMPYNPFDAALEGTNAGKLYQGAGDVQKFAEGLTPPTKQQSTPPDPGQSPATTPQGTEGEGPDIKPKRGNPYPTKKPIGSP